MPILQRSKLTWGTLILECHPFFVCISGTFAQFYWGVLKRGICGSRLVIAIKFSLNSPMQFWLCATVYLNAVLVLLQQLFFSIRLTYRKVLCFPTPHLFPFFPVIFLCALGVMPGDCIPANCAFTRSTRNLRLGGRYRKALVEWHQSQGRLRRWRLSRWLGVATQSFQRWRRRRQTKHEARWPAMQTSLRSC